MANLNALLKSEIARISKRENKSQFIALNSKIIEMRRALLGHKRLIKNLENEIAVLSKQAGKGGIVPKVPEDVLKKSRLSGSMIARLRHRLNLSRAALGKILGVNQNSIYLWEVDRSSPRPNMRAKIIQLRKTGKREIRKCLGDVKNKMRKPRVRKPKEVKEVKQEVAAPKE